MKPDGYLNGHCGSGKNAEKIKESACLTISFSCKTACEKKDILVLVNLNGEYPAISVLFFQKNDLTNEQLPLYSFLTIYEVTMKSFVKVMKALSDPNRVKIIKLLQLKFMCVCELQGALNLAQSTVSKHLKILEEAGLVDFNKDGLWVNYYLADGKNSPYAASLLGNLQHWLNEDMEIAELMKIAPFINREDICRN